MTFGAAPLCALLEELLPDGVTGLMVGLSGGGDSACLLAALAQAVALPRRAPPHRALPRRGLPARAPTAPRMEIRAVHIDHGLQASAPEFRAASAALCARLSIPLTVITIAVDAAGASIEAAAREARYRAFARELAPGECLLTAHHANDQAETLLLQLLRGAGLPGLAAMPGCRRLGRGWHVRPLLAVSQRELLAFGAAHGVQGTADPMNHDTRFDRAFVRAHLWPLIEARWPGAAPALGRTAQHLAQAQALLEQSAGRRLRRLRDGDALSVTGLRALSTSEQINTLRHWLSSAAVEPPPAARLAEALRQMLDAQPDHLPAIAWGAHALRRYRDRLFLTPALVPALGAPCEWSSRLEARVELGPGLGRLRWASQPGGLDAARLPSTLSVRRRRGGEVLKAAPRARTQSVQHLCQSRGVLPWMRDALPMVYAHDTLIAVGDLWHDARWCVAAGAAGVRCVWEGAPTLG